MTAQRVVSVVIPVYNSSQTILPCLYSVFKELMANDVDWEIIIVDDGSSDDSADKIVSFIKENNFDYRIKFIRQINKGAAEARNAGLRLAKGELIAFNDSDDEWLPGKLALQLSCFKEDPSIDMIGGLHGNSKLSFPFKKVQYMNPININQMLFKFYFPTPGVIFKRKLLDKTGLFPSNRRNSEEGIFFYKMVYWGNCVLINQMLTKNILGKHTFGVSGLTGQIHRQSFGELINLRTIHKENIIGTFQYICAMIFSLLKYGRRIVIYYTNLLAELKS